MTKDKSVVRNVCWVCAPSNTMASMKPEFIEIGVRRLESLGFKVQFSEHVMQTSLIEVAPLQQRVMDFQKVQDFADITCIIPVFGGYNSNALLTYINYEFFEKSDIQVIGYSDITAILNAIYTRTGQKSIHGLSFSALCEPNLNAEALRIFTALLRGEENIIIKSTTHVAEDLWFLNDLTSPREWYKSGGWQIIHPGIVEGQVVGGNLETFLALVGTPFFPDLRDKILLIESDPHEQPRKLLRELHQLAQMQCFDKIKGLIIGSFSKENLLYDNNLLKIILQEVITDISFPIISNTNFSHIDPIYSLPIGGLIELHAQEKDIFIRIL